MGRPPGEPWKDVAPPSPESRPRGLPPAREHGDHHCLSGSICDELGLCVLRDGAESLKRLRLAAAAALERTQVGDAEEATAILEAVVRLDGSLVVPERPPTV